MQMHTSFARNRHARAIAAGCVALAAGGIVLLRAPKHPAAGIMHPTRTTPETVSATRTEFRDSWLRGRTALSQGAVLAHGTRQVYAEVRVAAERNGTTAGESRPVAMAVVLDVSGSMSGEKIDQAKTAVLELADRMRDSDQIALVTYSDGARVVQPLAPVGEVRARLRTVVPTIGIEGGTNIPSGLALGASALAQANANLIRRVVLVSDGQDGSGRPLPQITSEVRGRADEGVTLSSLGIGTDFDERFMSGVADAGRGNYEFLRRGAELRGFLARELQQATATTVERSVAEVSLPPGWRLTRAYGAEAQGTTGTVRLPIGSLFAGDERRVVLDLSVDAQAPGEAGALATTVSYRAVREGRDVRLDAGMLALRVRDSEADVTASRDVAVYAEAESTAVAAAQAQALAAWNDGRTAEARALVRQNVARLQAVQAAAPAAAPALARQADRYAQDDAIIGTVSGGSAAGRAHGMAERRASREAMQRSYAY